MNTYTQIKRLNANFRHHKFQKHTLENAILEKEEEETEKVEYYNLGNGCRWRIYNSEE